MIGLDTGSCHNVMYMYTSVNPIVVMVVNKTSANYCPRLLQIMGNGRQYDKCILYYNDIYQPIVGNGQQ